MKKPDIKDTGVTIDQIELTVAGKKLELTLEQARALRDILNEALPLGAPHTGPIWTYPIIVDRRPAWPDPYWLPTITCENDTTTLCLATP